MSELANVLKYIDVYPDDAGKVAQRLHIKKEDIPFERKVFASEKYEPATKEEAKKLAEERAVISYISTEDVDRDGDIVLAAGVNTKFYEQSGRPVFFGHQYQTPSDVVGQCQWIKHDPERKGLVAKTVFRNTQFADDVYKLYTEELIPGQGAILRGFSIGFIPIKAEEPKKGKDALPDGLRRIFSEIELLEYSTVPISSCRSALTIIQAAYAKGFLNSKSVKKYFDLSFPSSTIHEDDSTSVEPVEHPDTPEVATEPPVDTPERELIEAPGVGAVGYVDKEAEADSEAVEAESAETEIPEETATETKADVEPWEGEELELVATGEIADDGTMTTTFDTDAEKVADETEAVKETPEPEATIIVEIDDLLQEIPVDGMDGSAEGETDESAIDDQSDEENVLDLDEPEDVLDLEESPDVLELDEMEDIEIELSDDEKSDIDYFQKCLDTLEPELGGHYMLSEIDEFERFGRGFVRLRIGSNDYYFDSNAKQLSKDDPKTTNAVTATIAISDMPQVKQMFADLEAQVAELKEGRVLSSKSRKIVKSTIDSLGALTAQIDEALADLRKLYAATDPDGGEVDDSEQKDGADQIDIESIEAPVEVIVDEATVAKMVEGRTEEIVRQLASKMFEGDGMQALIDKALDIKIKAKKGIVE